MCEQVSMSKCLSLFVHVTESVSLGIAVEPNNNLKLLYTHTRSRLFVHKTLLHRLFFTSHRDYKTV